MFISTDEYQDVCDHNKEIGYQLYNKLSVPEVMHDVKSFSGGYIDSLTIEYEPTSYRIVSASGYLYVVGSEGMVFFKAPCGKMVACKPELNESEEAILSRCFHMSPKKYGALMPLSVYWYAKDASDVLVAALMAARKELS